MKTHHSNARRRRNAILKAIAFTLVPMLLSALGMYLFMEAGTSERARYSLLEGQIEASRKEKAYFLDMMKRADSLWAGYVALHKEYFKQLEIAKAAESTDPEMPALLGQLEGREKAIQKTLGELKGDLRDTAFIGVYYLAIDYYRSRINNYALYRNSKKLLYEQPNGEIDHTGCIAQLDKWENRVNELDKEVRQRTIDLARCESSKGGTDCRAQEKEITALERQLENLQKRNGQLLAAGRELEQRLTRQRESEEKFLGRLKDGLDFSKQKLIDCVQCCQDRVNPVATRIEGRLLEMERSPLVFTAVFNNQ